MSPESNTLVLLSLRSAQGAGVNPVPDLFSGLLPQKRNLGPMFAPDQRDIPKGGTVCRLYPRHPGFMMDDYVMRPAAAALDVSARAVKRRAIGVSMYGAR